MKKSLILLLTTISLHSICQERITPFTEVYSSKTTTLKLCTSTGEDSIVKAFEPGRIYLLDLNSKKKGKSLKGEVIATLLRDNEVFFALYSKDSELKFNRFYDPVVAGFNFFSIDERMSFKHKSRSYNDDFYGAIRREKQKLIDEENKRIREIQKAKEDSIRVLKETLEIYSKDSLKSISFIDEPKSVKIYSDRLDSICKAWIDRGNLNGGILISEFENYQNSIGFHNVSFGVFNCTKKKIKYVSASFKAFNSVNDQVGSIETLKGIGFVNPGEFGEWEFENVWHSSIINSVSIVNMKITYEDGSVKTVTKIPNVRIDNIGDGELKKDLESYIFMRDSYKAKFVGFVKSIEVQKSSNGYSILFFDINDGGTSIMDIDSKFISDANEIIEKINSGTKPFYNNTFSINQYNSSIYMKDDANKRIVLWIDDLQELLRLTSEK